METATVEYEPTIEAWTDASSGEFDYGKKNVVSEVLNGDHFYPTEENANGKDLLVEYSILWNESMLNFLGGSANPWIHTFVGSDTVAKGNNICYWSPVAGRTFAGKITSIRPRRIRKETICSSSSRSFTTSRWRTSVETARS